MPESSRELAPWRNKLHEVIFEADTPAGRAFDLWLLVLILVSVTAAVFETVTAVQTRFGTALRAIEWICTILFTIEYVLRLLSVGRPLQYARSFFGIVDLVAIIPTYLSLFFSGAHALIVIRALRLLRVFRILKLVQFVGEAAMLREALRASARKIIIFIGTVMTVTLVIGTSMYLIEGEENGFTSIPKAVYWAIVTMTTVGYGDITPHTIPGRILAAIVMIIGYGIIAVPTGIVTAEMTGRWRRPVSTQACPQCSAEGHDVDATYCKFCSAEL